MIKTAVDFSYAFSTPHRLTVALPDSGDKTLLDLFPGRLRMAWTYDNAAQFPLAAFATPKTDWEVNISPDLDGQPFAASEWHRAVDGRGTRAPADRYLPILDNTYRSDGGQMRLEIAGGVSATLLRVELRNAGNQECVFGLRCQVPGGWAGYLPAWVNRSWDHDVLMAGWKDRADRVTLLAPGADEYKVVDRTTLYPCWHVAAGQTRVAWLVRPYRCYESDLPALRSHDWAQELADARAAWHALFDRAARVHIPDPGVRDGFYACLADLFIMREPVAGGYIAAEPGTEVYRAPNAIEAAVVAVALDQTGLAAESANGYQMCLDQQGDDGNWADPKGWCHHFWATSGFKSWAVMEHYRLTGDKAYLRRAYPRMVASSRWQERQRRATRAMENGARPFTYGLLPRGMGDAGLWDDQDPYGVFLPHNIWAVYADKLTVEAAEILEQTADLAELRTIYATARHDLLDTLRGGAIQESDYRWIPAVAGKTSGSRWGVLNAAFPCELLAPGDELITGTIRKMEQRISPGGVPLHTGWMENGMWVAITLDNLAEVLLTRGESDKAAAYLNATLNHGTPLYSWCEERGPLPGAADCAGDRQHLWTPVAVVRFIRDALVMEEGDGLHLARGTARDWLATGEPVGVRGAATHFGTIAYSLHYDAAAGRVTGEVTFPARTPPGLVRLHVRLPVGVKLISVDAGSGAAVTADGEALEWLAPCGSARFGAVVGKDTAAAPAGE